MTIIEALSRLANRYAKNRYAGLTADEQIAGIDALNRGLMETFELLPDVYRQKEISLTVEAPTSVTLDAVSGSATLGFPAFTADHYGRSVIASGDEAVHRVAGESSLRDVWLGSTGSHPAVVYHDYVYGGDYPFDRLLSVPKLLSGRDELPLELINPEDIEVMRLRSIRGVGRPRFYWLEQGGVSQGETIATAIRLLPFPEMAYRIRIRASFWPRRIRFSDVSTNAPLPVPDAVAEAFIQISGAHIIGLPGWDSMGADEIMTHAQMGRARVARTPQTFGSPMNRIGTPRGW